MGHDWHPECFQCDKCHIPLSPDNFYEKNGRPYCENDYHKLFSPKCCACNKPIKERVSFFGGASVRFSIWHLNFVGKIWNISFLIVAGVCIGQRVASQLFHLFTSTLWSSTKPRKLWTTRRQAVLPKSFSGDVFAKMFRLQKANHRRLFYFVPIKFSVIKTQFAIFYRKLSLHLVRLGIQNVSHAYSATSHWIWMLFEKKMDCLIVKPIIMPCSRRNVPLVKRQSSRSVLFPVHYIILWIEFFTKIQQTKQIHFSFCSLIEMSDSTWENLAPGTLHVSSL